MGPLGAARQSDRLIIRIARSLMPANYHGVLKGENPQTESTLHRADSIKANRSGFYAGKNNLEVAIIAVYNTGEGSQCPLFCSA